MDSLLPGTEVVARDLRWEVVFTQGLGDQTLFRLRGLEGAVKGQELDLLHPFEPIQPIQHDLLPEHAAPLTNWLVYHQAFLLEQSLGRDAFLAAQPGRLHTEPYQLVPVLRAIRSNRVRLLLADGVGLGKTIQAGLVITELMARRLAHRILIVSPAGPLLDQWRTEMRERFSLRLEELDRSHLEEIRRSTEIGANPFDFVALGLASIDFLKQERILDQLERASYDLIVIDEAHHCFDLGVTDEHDDSQRRRLAQVLSRRCDALLLLTATPHDGNDRSFASLCQLLDPSLVDVRGNLVGERFKRHVIRRLKGQIKDPKTGALLFRERQVIPRAVEPNAEENKFVELIASLRALIGPELRKAFRARRYSDVLSFVALLKRSVSTVAACQSTLLAVRKRIGAQEELQETKRQRLRTLRDYYRRLERFGALGAEEERDRELLEIEDLAERLTSLQREIGRDSRSLSKTRTVAEELDCLIALANSALKQDPKLRAVVAEIQEIRHVEPDANVLVYTEYLTSQKPVADTLSSLGEVLTMSGEDDDEARSKVTSKFRRQNGLILVSTDAAAEGLNLHERCHHLIHLELPFNPNRLEQRNGRIDRYGQKHDPIVRYLYLRDSFEERILLRLIAKYERQRARLNYMPNTLGLTASTDTAAERLLKGFIEEDALPLGRSSHQFQFFAGNENDGADEATREILEAEDRVLSGFEAATHKYLWLGQVGIGAEPENLDQANSAMGLGKLVSPVDLAAFIRDAVLLEHGNIEGKISDPVFTLTLPPSWNRGLDEYPGFDIESRHFRLTTDVNLLRDSQDRSVSYLGRAHPLVRMALERVRNLSFGSDSQSRQDVRVSALQGQVDRPTLLFTFMGRVSSKLARELERVLAVALPKDEAPQAYSITEQWLRFTLGHSINVKDIWKKHFESWGTQKGQLAARLALQEFQPIAEEFRSAHNGELADELEYQKDWIAERSREIAVAIQPTAVQAPLFGTASAGPTVATRDWMAITDPERRLEAFSKDPSQPPLKRSEAEIALRVYRSRVKELTARLALQSPEVIPLGMLMIIPEVHRAA